MGMRMKMWTRVVRPYERLDWAAGPSGELANGYLKGSCEQGEEQKGTGGPHDDS